MCLSCCNNTSAAQNIAAPCLICRRRSRTTASQFDGLLFALSSLRRFRTAIKSPEVCCTLRSSSFVALAVVLHFCSSHTNKHSGKKKKTNISNTFRMEAALWEFVHLRRRGGSGQCDCGESLRYPPKTLPRKKKYTFHAKYRLRVPSAPFGPQQRNARRGLRDVKSACKRFAGVEK